MMNAETATMIKNDTNAAARYEMTEKLSAKMHITLEEARSALEAADWNTLTATHMLEQEMFRRKQELNAFAASAAEETDARTEADASAQAATADDAKPGERAKKLGRAIADLIARGNRSRLVVHKGNERLMEVPVTLVVLLLVCSFGTCAFLMVLGLLAGCRYSFNGLAEA